MELQALTHDERLALVALVEWMVKSDSRTAAEEIEPLARVVHALGDDAYQALADEVASRFSNDADLRAFLPSIARPEAREVVFATLLDVAMGGSVDTRESEMLDWLADLWDVEVEYEDDGSAG